MIRKKQVIEYLERIQQKFIKEHLEEYPEDANNDYIECEKAEELQNTIYILEDLED